MTAKSEGLHCILYIGYSISCLVFAIVLYSVSMVMSLATHALCGEDGGGVGRNFIKGGGFVVCEAKFLGPRPF